MDTQKLKSLQVKRSKIQGDLDDIRKTLKELETRMVEREKALSQIQQELNELADSNPVVSEHALLRYVERVLGINLKEAEKDIMSKENLEIINQLSSGKIPFMQLRVQFTARVVVKKDLVLVVKNKTVITIIDQK